MKRILHSLAFLLVAIAITVFMNGCRHEGPSLRIKVYIDGSDVMKVQGNKLWFEHEEWQVPRNPIYINGKSWSPGWKDKVSDTFESLNPSFLPTDAHTLKLTVKLGRGKVTIKEMPTPANNQTLAVRFDDNDFGGADWYDVIVSW